MKVTVQFANISQEIEAKVASRIREKWPEVAIENRQAPTEENGAPHAYLLIGTDPAPSPSKTFRQPQATVPVEGASLNEIFFLVDAKLGRLTKSDPLERGSNPAVTSPMSRRDFLFGALRKAHEPNDAPVVSVDSCEARFGCRKCVDACPTPDALKIVEKAVVVSSEHCIRCGLCAGICPVAAIQVPGFSEAACRGLVTAIQDSPAPRKTLVITCNERSVRQRPWMDIEEVPGVGVMGVRQLALAASSSVSETIVYCPDGLCAGKENASKAAVLISSLANEPTPVVSYLEGKAGADRINEIHASARERKNVPAQAVGPWRDYLNSLVALSVNRLDAEGFGLTDMKVADSCTLCNGCVESCPHRALGIQGGELNFNSEECTGCGYCAEICPEHSITLAETRGPATVQKKIVFKDEMVRCSECGVQYASAKMVKKISTMLQDDRTTKLCPNCRQDEIHEKLFGPLTNMCK